MLNGQVIIASQLPAKSSDASTEHLQPRGNGYGESYNQSTTPDGLDALLSEGSYFSGVISGYVPGTGVTGAVQTTFSDTSALVALTPKSSSSSNAKIIRPDTLKLICSATGTGITAIRLVAVIDSASRLVAPGGSPFVFNTNGGLSGNAQSVAIGYAGALAIGAATPAKKIVGQCILKPTAPALNDEFLIRFSNAAQPSSNNVRHMEPVALLPGQALIIHAFFTGATVGVGLEPLLTTIER